MAELEILGAVYGLTNVTNIISSLVSRQTTPQTLSVLASNSIFNDPSSNISKTLVVISRYGERGKPQVSLVQENHWLQITPPPFPPDEQSAPEDEPPITPITLTIHGAAYGLSDQTSKVKSLLNPSSQSLNFPINPSTFSLSPPSSSAFPRKRETFVLCASFGKDGKPFIHSLPAQGQIYSLTFRPPLKILSAAWGSTDVTSRIRKLVRQRYLPETAVSEYILGDGGDGGSGGGGAGKGPTGMLRDERAGRRPAAKTKKPPPKALTVLWQYGDEVPLMQIRTEGEGVGIEYTPLPPGPPGRDGGLEVLGASYGLEDVTEKVRRMVSGGEKLCFVVDDRTLGGGCAGMGVRKSLALTLRVGAGEPRLVIKGEGEYVYVDSGQWGG